MQYLPLLPGPAILPQETQAIPCSPSKSVIYFGNLTEGEVGEGEVGACERTSGDLTGALS